MSDGRFVLAIDTAGARCAVGLADAEGGVAAFRDPLIGKGHAERLMPLAGEVLAEAGATWRDVARIVVAVGPGSFTGLRVGVAAARGLALALDVPAIGVSNLEALAEPWRANAPVLAAIDAKRGEVYLAIFGPDDAVIRAPVVLPFDELAGILASETPHVLVGSGVPAIADRLARPDLVGQNPENRLDLAALARIGVRRGPKEAPRPLYLRGADAKPQQSRLSVAR